MTLIRNSLITLICLVPWSIYGQQGLPPIPHQDSQEVIELGKALFFDRRLSVNNTLSCAMCHIPEQGFAQNQLATPVGLEGKTLKRNSPTLLNIAYMPTLFHDGREFDLVNQVWSPLLDKREMGNLSIGLVLETIRGLEDYEQRFTELLGGINAISVGIAIAAYEKTLNAGNSPFDRWFFGQDENAVNNDVKAGFTLFARHGCAACHEITRDHALFTDGLFHNTGIGYERAMKPKAGTRTVQLTDTISIETDESFEGEVFNDLGRYEVTGQPIDRWRYRTPSLRNIELTAPYMHDGSMQTLEDVIEYYMAGGFEPPDPNQDQRLLPFVLNTDEVAQLVAFLNALTSDHIDELIEEARNTPIGD